MPDRDVNKFLRAADQRLTSADLLYDHDLYLDSMYLAGYAPECALKALILARIPRKARRQYVKDHFRGRLAHNLEHLKDVLQKCGVPMPPAESKFLRRIASWSTDLRYEVGRKKPREAREFLDAAKALRDWARRSL